MRLTDLALVALFTVLLPILCWALIARTRSVGFAVGIALLLVPIGIVLGLARGLPFPGGTDLLFAYPVVALVVILAGRGVERRFLRATKPAATAKAVYILLSVHMAGILCLCVPAMLFMVDTEELHTSTGVLLPLPGGLRVASDSGDDCGMAVCLRRIVISSTSGDSDDEVERQLRDHLAGRGWNLDSDGSDCRKLGWFIDQRVLCVSVRRSPTSGVLVQLEGSQAWA
ncbi:MAG: hypothetical protein HOU81_13880 [Hamadaea sp.]|uniref:hypothetical protein n=1 Tax=Hamadaea sp. TaxID=2024425 RepID=UPI0017F9C7EE|nr:hypothetical protein [Hamadaea sp.]NUR71907.1 hypothetical protein [Hamadaea sp.]NUT17967.1 hypothetical protein [Hamadaea sp.]